MLPKIVYIFRSAVLVAFVSPQARATILSTSGGFQFPDGTTQLSAALAAAATTLTDAASIAVNAAAGNVFDLTLTRNHAMANPTALGSGGGLSGAGNVGGAGGGVTGANGVSAYDGKSAYGGNGGTATAAGATPLYDYFQGNSAGPLVGGAPIYYSYGGGGGGGYYGGSGGSYSESNTMAGGGGGSGSPRRRRLRVH